MSKIDKTIIKETKFISALVLLFSVLLQSIFLIIGKWDYTVLLGNILSGGISILNFFLMGLSVQSALKKDEKDAKATMKFSQTYRSFMMLCVIVLGVVLPCFNVWTVFIPVFFPRIAVSLRPLFDKKK